MKAAIEIIKKSRFNSFLPYIPAERTADIRSGDSICLGIQSAKGDKIYGAGIVSLVKTKGRDRANLLELESVYIDPEYRNKGLFKSFISQLKKETKKRGLAGIVTETVYPDMEELENTLRTLGFKSLEDGNTVYEGSLSDFYHIPTLDRATERYNDYIYSFDELTPAQLSQWESGFGRKFPWGLTPDRLPGKWQMRYSYLFIRKNMVKCYLLTSVLPDGRIYIGAIYSEIGNGHAVAAVLGRFLEDMEKGGMYDRFMFAAATKSGLNLSEHIIKMVNAGHDRHLIHNFYLRF